LIRAHESIVRTLDTWPTYVFIDERDVDAPQSETVRLERPNE